jgi:hypothetical protein
MPKPKPSEKLIAEHFALFEYAAVRSLRCPKNSPFGPIQSPVLRELYRRGMIKGEIYISNWRVITLLVGPNAGKSTATFPGAGKPYKICGVEPHPSAKGRIPVRHLPSKELER